MRDKDGRQTYDQALTVSSVINNTLQLDSADLAEADGLWDIDDTGWNFKATIPASAFPENKHYRAQFKFTPASGGSSTLTRYQRQ